MRRSDASPELVGVDSLVVNGVGQEFKGTSLGHHTHDLV